MTREEAKGGRKKLREERHDRGGDEGGGGGRQGMAKTPESRMIGKEANGDKSKAR
jgi:hypothetical protein